MVMLKEFLLLLRKADAHHAQEMLFEMGFFWAADTSKCGVFRDFSLEFSHVGGYRVVSDYILIFSQQNPSGQFVLTFGSYKDDEYTLNHFQKEKTLNKLTYESLKDKHDEFVKNISTKAIKQKKYNQWSEWS